MEAEEGRKGVAVEEAEEAKEAKDDKALHVAPLAVVGEEAHVVGKDGDGVDDGKEGAGEARKEAH